jgi:hypothetical protein
LATDDTLLWIATALPLGILICLAVVQGVKALVEHRRQLWLDAEEEDALPDRRGRSTRHPRRGGQGPGRDEAAQRP